MHYIKNMLPIHRKIFKLQASFSFLPKPPQTTPNLYKINEMQNNNPQLKTSLE